MKRMLDLGTDAGLRLLDLQQQRFHGVVFHLLDGSALGSNTAAGFQGILLFVQVLPHTGVACVAVYLLAIVSDELARHGDIGRGGGNTVGQSSDRIDTDSTLQRSLATERIDAGDALPGVIVVVLDDRVLGTGQD
ncbi:hypothetical protein EHLJMEHL_04929 [Vreelandella titanicae]